MGSDWSCSAVFPGTVSGVVDAACWIERLSADRGCPEGLSFGIQLCVEELLTNVVRHGGGAWLENAEMPAAAAPGVSISIGIMRSDDVIILVIEDDGTPFDITAAPAKPVHRRVEEAQPGGLGGGSRGRAPPCAHAPLPRPARRAAHLLPGTRKMGARSK